MLAFYLVLTALMLVVIYTDITRYIIPNWLNLTVLLLFPVMYFTSPDLPEGYSVWMALAIMLAVFAFGFVLFATHILGGGDVKLLTALALWTGAQASLEFLFLFAILGGVFVILLVMLREIVDPADVQVHEWRGSARAKWFALPALRMIDYIRFCYRFVLSPVRKISHRYLTEENLPRILKHAQPAAYGVPIAIAFLYLLWEGKIPGLPLTFAALIG